MQNIIDEMARAPEQIKKTELNILELKNEAMSIKEQLDGIRRAIACEVAASLTDDGKKAFSNAEAREAETEKRLQQDETYQKLKNSLQALETKKAEEEIGLQCLRDVFSVNRYKVRLYTADKVEKAASAFYGGMTIVDKLENILSFTNKAANQSYRDETITIPEDCPF